MAVTEWLIDKSALVRLAETPDAALWAERIERGLVRITTLTRLEIGYSARSGEDARSLFANPPVSAMPVEDLTPAGEDRAVAEAAARLIPDGRTAAVTDAAYLVPLEAPTATTTLIREFWAQHADEVHDLAPREDPTPGQSPAASEPLDRRSR